MASLHPMYRMLFLGILFLGFGCSQAQKKQVKAGTGTRYAQYFQVIRHKDFKEIRILNPDHGMVQQKYALSRNPELLHLDGSYIPVKTPIRSIISLNGTDIGYLSRLGLVDRIKGISNINYVDNPYLLKQFKQGKLTEIHDLEHANPEQIMQTAQVLTYSSFGTAPHQEKQLSKLGVLCIPMYDWRETHPLGKAEWMCLLAHFFEQESRAKVLFDKTCKNYQALLKKAVKCSSKPRVLSGSMIGDSWYMPAGNSFNAVMFRHAGCAYAGNERGGTGSTPYPFEDVYKRFGYSDIWVNPMFSNKKDLLQANGRYAYFDAFKSGEIYCYSHRMNYFWENSASEPDKVLSDLIQIFHPEAERKKLYFYRKITP